MGKKIETIRFPVSQHKEELLLRCGEIVPKSGIYHVIHKQHEGEPESSSVVALAGEIVQSCRYCGEAVQLRLTYAAPHVSEDKDFFFSPEPRN